MKENEALLALATRLFEKGDIDRAYSYISYALNDANFYNSRFKNHRDRAPLSDHREQLPL